MNKPYVVIMAGGSGERLWPLSRRKRPKQTLNFKDQQSLLEKTIERIQALVPISERIIVTAQDQVDSIEASVGDLVGAIIAEPVARNTAAAFILAAALVHQEDPEAVIMFTPCDHYIPQTEKYIGFMEHAFDRAANSSDLVLLGLTPHYPATGYGYIAPAQQDSFPAAVEKFHEKPTALLAEEYCVNGYLWNSGIIVARASVFLQTAHHTAPDVYAAVYAYIQEDAPYENIPKISVDYAILEKAKNCVVLPADLAWCDVGNLETFLSLKDQQYDQSHVVSIDSKNNLVEVEDMLVALVGMENVCVIQNDNILLVVNRDQVEKVKMVLDVLKAEQHEEYL
jgi:mannose-1-phosphate guanylyltransferase/mannose-6-phosphate isomerase